ncbi:MAG: alpha/beta hydrolase [Actinobacteria bacterium]|nr:alpha/beta hydrolase [Actinomycetota bacterium]MBV9936470.1 alpha/beta hydrolase [Actinomycetota bacterium]
MMPGGAGKDGTDVRTACTVRLPDGRDLGYADWGDPGGTPVLHLHGTPGSRLTYDYADGPARDLGVRVIAPDRPGIGLSSAKPGYSLDDIAADMAELADGLGLDRFAMLAWSGGGPYGLATAAALGDRVSALAMVAPAGLLDTRASRKGMSGLDRAGWMLSMFTPRLGAPMLGAAMRWSLRHPVNATKSFASKLPRIEMELLAALPPAVEGPIIGSAEAGRQGGRGIVDDYRAISRPWTFRPEDVQVRTQFWHGDQDKYVPLRVSEELAERVPNAELRLRPGSGHLIALSHYEEILTDLLN